MLDGEVKPGLWRWTKGCLPVLSAVFTALLSPTLILSLPPGALRVVDVEVEPWSLWRATFLNKLSLPETQSARVLMSIQSHLMTLLLGPSIVWVSPQSVVKSLLVWGLSFPCDTLSFQSNPVFSSDFTRGTFLFVTQVQSVWVAVKNLSEMLPLRITACTIILHQCLGGKKSGLYLIALFDWHILLHSGLQEFLFV